ncbi:glycosyltransferase family 4 protein [Waterburya agarophytonicola K14]|uniref:Glycosyltransferase family 4 protein n=1 Tax=Waterburya agarophytonicola KI4 TaxID=2874699 RepID=A0A964FG63_9CYAN|nr:glycosyltransferase family 4 protein [Waterburya agarophytonicola]MCC0177656.1 glycosyltransferase family 4 protein [Waterburya agarophytonicola KI4]
MKVLFLDQTGKLAGAERVLLDLVKPYKQQCLVGLFEDGPFQELLTKQNTPVTVLASKPIEVKRESSLLQGVSSLGKFIPLLLKIVKLSRDYDLIYANTPKAMVIGALASALSDRPFVYHLHDILTPEHFSTTNRRLIVILANRFANKIIAVSQAAREAFIEAGGKAELVEVIYNGFEASQFQGYESQRDAVRQELGFDDKFIVGHFCRLSPWKGQDVLLKALTQCPDNVVAVFVGDALFGEEEYAARLKQQVKELNLTSRVRFLGFRRDVPRLMTGCDLIAHTSTAPEPASRVLVETMLSGKPLVASKNGGTMELVEEGKMGWLFPSGDYLALAKTINQCQQDPENTAKIAASGQKLASDRFTLERNQQQVDRLLQTALRF